MRGIRIAFVAVVLWGVLIEDVAIAQTESSQAANSTSQESRPASVVVPPTFEFGTAPVRYWLGRKIDTANSSAKSVTWSETSLRSRLRRYAQTQQIGIFLDRRVDPESNPDFAMSGVTNEHLLWKLAAAHQTHVCRLGNVYYFGPASTVAQLPGRIGELKLQTARMKKQSSVPWHRSFSLETDPLVEPGRLLESLASKHGFQITNPELIPHDLWLGFDLPTMTLAEQFQVLLAGFDLSFERNSAGDVVTLIQLPRRELIERDFAFPRDVKVAERNEIVSRLQTQFPQLKIEPDIRKGISVSGRPEDVLRLEAEWVAFQRPLVNQVTGTTGRNRKSKDVFSWNIEASRGSILATVAKESNCSLQAAAAYREVLQQRVRVNVVNGTLDEIVSQALAGTQLKGTLTNGKLVIEARQR